MEPLLSKINNGFFVALTFILHQLVLQIFCCVI